MNKQKKMRIFTIALCSILLLPVIAIGLSFVFPASTVTDVNVGTTDGDSSESLSWHGHVTVSKNGEVIYEGSNLLTNAGADHIKTCLGAGTCGSAFDYIAVGNGTAPAEGSTTLNSEIASAGLSRAQGSYTSLGTGHWKIEEVFTVTGTINSVNSTGLFNASSSGTMIAGDTFSDTNVENGDSLNITWDITQSYS